MLRNILLILRKVAHFMDEIPKFISLKFMKFRCVDTDFF